LNSIKRASVVAVLGVAAIALSACASDGAGPSDSAGGETLKIMAFGSLSQPPFPLPQLADGAKAAVDRINADGGVNGRQIELITCDDQGTANGATACGQQAVQEQVLAVVGQFTLFGDAFVGLTDAAGIPLVFSTATSSLEVSSDLSFPVVGALPPSIAALVSFGEQGCETTIITANDNAQSRATYSDFLLPIAEIKGFKTGFVPYPPDTTDFAGVAADVASQGDCVIYAGGAPDSSAIMIALEQSNADITHQAALSTIAISDETLTELGEVSDGLQVFTNGQLPSSGDDAVVQAQEDILAVNPDANVDLVALNAYAGVLAFAQVAGELDEVTSAGIAEAMNDPATTFDSGLFPPINFSEDSGFYPLTPRVAGSQFFGYVAEGGKFVPNGDLTVDLSGLAEEME
jgi:ABC-type branched-subunit amino acid transport system substrate-binding protein